MKIKGARIVLAMAAAGLLLAGCATYVPAGGLFVGTKWGLSANPGVAGSKTGKACMHSVLALVAWGDATIDDAMRAGNISKVATVDYEVQNPLGIYGTYCTVVTGE